MSIDPAEPCAGEWFLNWGTGVDGHWFVQIECNGGDVGDCGWVQPLDLLEQTGCITSEDVLGVRGRPRAAPDVGEEDRLICLDGSAALT